MGVRTPVIFFYSQICLVPSWRSPNSEFEADAILVHPFHCGPAAKPATPIAQTYSCTIDEALEAY